tara:strand:- start:827 stop:1192 length:366 start_codon:yes stop_codon:yes gene_type:complete
MTKKLIKIKKILINVFIGLTLSYAEVLHPGKSLKSDSSSSISNKYFLYPSNLINYSINGSSFVEFNLNKKGQIENFNIINSLGYPFDKSIIEGLDEYVSNEIDTFKENIGKHYRLEIKFKN